YLKRFRFDVLKIDRSFVTGLPDNPDDVLLVKAILAMAKGFDIQVVAEGVEKHDQLNFLAKQGCDYCQGFLLGKPMTGEEFRNYLKDQRAGLESLRFSTTRQPHTSSAA
ncbi:MAG: EAL domain-containing protein, partial [Candidatus Acidiferrum sp.]